MLQKNGRTLSKSENGANYDKNDSHEPTGAVKDALSMIADIIVEDMIRVEREQGIRPRDFPAYYEDRRKKNRDGGVQP